MNSVALSGLVGTWMDKMVDWFKDTLLGAADNGAENMLETLSCDLARFKSQFAIADKAYTAIIIIAYAMVLLILLISLVKSMTLPVRESENPWRLVARFGVSAFAVGWGLQICQIFLDLAQVPYKWFVTDSGYFESIGQTIWTSLFVAMFGEADGIGPKLFSLVLVIMVAWNYFKMLLELVEHYVVLGFLSYMSPLAFSCYTSAATENVTKSYIKMFFSQLIMMILSSWFVIGANLAIKDYINAADGGPMLWAFCMVAFLKTAQRVDSYLKALGLNAATTGANIGDEILGTVSKMATVGHMASGAVHTAGKAAGAVFGAGTVSAATSGDFAKAASNVSADTIGVAANSKDAAGVAGGMPKGDFGFAQKAAAAAENQAVRSGVSQVSAGTFSAVANDSNSSRIIDDSVTAASRDFGNYMPGLAGENLSNTSVESGKFSTTTTDPTTGKQTNLEGFNTSMYSTPVGDGYRMMQAADGSTWAVKATGDGADSFYKTPYINGSADASSFSADAADKGISSISNVSGADGNPEKGILSATMDDGSTAMLYNTGMYDMSGQEGMETLRDMNGNEWGIVPDAAQTPDFAPESPAFDYDDDPDAYKSFFTDSTADAWMQDSDVVSHGDGVLSVSGGDNDGLWLRQGFENGTNGYDISGAMATMQDVNGDTWGFFPNADYNNIPAASIGVSSLGGTATPQFSGAESASAIQSQFTGLDDAVSAKTAGNGMIGITNADGSQSTLLNSGLYNEPAGNYSTSFAKDPITGEKTAWYNVPGAPGEQPAGVVSPRSGQASNATPQFTTTPQFSGAESAADFNSQFTGMGSVTSATTVGNGQIGVTNADGSQSTLFNAGMYDAPGGAHGIAQSTDPVTGKQSTWYTMSGAPGTQGEGTPQPHSNADGSAVQFNSTPQYNGAESAKAFRARFDGIGADGMDSDDVVSATTAGAGMIGVTNADGSQSTLYKKDMFNEPTGAYTSAYSDNADTGEHSEWYNMPGAPGTQGADAPQPRAASADSTNQFISTPKFNGAESAADFNSQFPEMGGVTSATTAGIGEIGVTNADGSKSTLYNSSMYNEPTGAHGVTHSTDPATGKQSTWYTMSGAPGTQGAEGAKPRPLASDPAPQFTSMPAGTSVRSIGADAAIATDQYGNTTRLTRNGSRFNAGKGPQYASSNGVWSGAHGNYAAPAAKGQSADTHQYTGAESAAQIQQDFPSMKNAVSANTIADGVVQMRDKQGGITTLYKDGFSGGGGYSAPSGACTHVTDANGNGYWQVNGGGGTVPAPASGSSQFSSDTSQDTFREAFPSMPEGTTFHAVGNGAVRATYENGSSDMLYSGANYSIPAGSESVSDSSGNSWMRVGAQYSTPEYHRTSASDFNQQAFSSFMPDYSATFGKEASSFHADKFDRHGRFEVVNSDGTGTKFYDTSMYKAPKGDYKVVQNANGHSYYGVPGRTKMKTEPMMENGRPKLNGNGEPMMSRRFEIDYGQSPQKISSAPPRKRTGSNTSDNKSRGPQRRRNR